MVDHGKKTPAFVKRAFPVRLLHSRQADSSWKLQTVFCT